MPTRSATKRFPSNQDLSGTRFTRLVVQGLSHAKGGKRHWHCLCDCGAKTVVSTTHLRSENSRSCGCLERDLLRQRATKHGGKRTPEYNAWCRMIGRCENSAIAGYCNYGGRGITVCGRWRNDFAAFLADVGHRPSPAHSIDRIDNDGHYEPGNVRWATRREQSRNTRLTVWVEIGGEVRPLVEWAEMMGMSMITIRMRIWRKGWTAKQALLAPVNKNLARTKSRRKSVTPPTE